MLRNIRLSLFVIINLVSFKISAVTVEIKAHITVTDCAMPATVILHSYADESFNPSAFVSKEGTFSFKFDLNGEAGLYNIRVAKSNFDVMLTAKEKICEAEISIDKNTLKGVTFKSNENDALRSFKATINIYDSKLNRHFIDCKSEEGCDEALNPMLVDYKRDLIDVQTRYPGTYTATVLCPMKIPTVNTVVVGTTENFRKRYFDAVPFKDSTLFNSDFYRDMISMYVDFIYEPKYSKEEEFIRSFGERIKANPLVLHKSAGLLYDELFNKKKEAMLGMFIKWYNTGDNKTAINNSVLELKIRNISRVMPGQTYMECVGPDTSGMLRSLKAIVDKNKCTLLLFWSSECHHCREEMPAIKEYYDKYHDKGFDVFAISLDPDKNKWKSFVKEKGLNWTNIIIGEMSDPNPARQYIITTTPTLILIDGKGNILHRFTPKSTLEKHILEALK